MIVGMSRGAVERGGDCSASDCCRSRCLGESKGCNDVTHFYLLQKIVKNDIHTTMSAELDVRDLIPYTRSSPSLVGDDE